MKMFGRIADAVRRLFRRRGSSVGLVVENCDVHLQPAGRFLFGGRGARIVNCRFTGVYANEADGLRHGGADG